MKIWDPAQRNFGALVCCLGFCIFPWSEVGECQQMSTNANLRTDRSSRAINYLIWSGDVQLIWHIFCVKKIVKDVAFIKWNFNLINSFSTLALLRFRELTPILALIADTSQHIAHDCPTQQNVSRDIFLKKIKIHATTMQC